MRYLFFLLPLLYGLDFFVLHGFSPSASVLWDVEAVSFGIVSSPTLLCILYWLRPYHSAKTHGKGVLLPKYYIELTKPVQIDVTNCQQWEGYKHYRTEEFRTVFRKGSWWQGEEIIISLNSDHTPKILWRSLNFSFYDNDKTAAFVRDCADKIQKHTREPQNISELCMAYFGQPFPDSLYPGEAFKPLEGFNGLIFATNEVGETPCLIPEQRDQVCRQHLRAYSFAGLWGYGANSSAFYYVSFSFERSIWLRLPFGGLYGDSQKQAQKIMCILNSLSTYTPPAGSHLTLIQNMGEGEIKLHKSGEEQYHGLWHFSKTCNVHELLHEQYFSKTTSDALM